MAKVEFFFDCSSPWTYMAFDGIQGVAERTGADVAWRPILVGGVFNAVNQGLYDAREAMLNNERRMRYFYKDMQDWARHCELKIGWPSCHPVNSVKAMRGCFVAEQQQLLVPYARRVFEAYWGEELDIANDEVLTKIVSSLGMNTEQFFAQIASPACKDKLRANSDELIARGGFGSPTMYVDGDDMYFGNDRLPLVEQALS
jgi:2-hydroxychromene-2-carboxylate isomerase